MDAGLQMKYFMLTPLKKNAYGAASRKALEAYAASIEDMNKELAEDIRKWLIEIHTNFLMEL